MTAISIDIAFIVVVFVCMFFVRPDLHKENGQSLLEFRDPLSLEPTTKNVRADENHQNDERRSS
ncbi:MAG: hypothetical protein WA723_06615 [Pseudolabrys sp.]